jgi:hypothetical protein
MSELTVHERLKAGAPFASYKKTTMGKVYVTTKNPFSGDPEGVLLEGEKGTESEVIDIWSDEDDVYFRRMNQKQFTLGLIIPYQHGAKPEVKPYEQYSDAELKEIIDLKYFAFTKILSDIKTEAVIGRMIDLAREMEKSEKIMETLTARLSELQKA